MSRSKCEPKKTDKNQEKTNVLDKIFTEIREDVKEFVQFTENDKVSREQKVFMNSLENKLVHLIQLMAKKDVQASLKDKVFESFIMLIESVAEAKTKSKTEQHPCLPDSKQSEALNPRISKSFQLHVILNFLKQPENVLTELFFKLSEMQERHSESPEQHSIDDIFRILQLKDEHTDENEKLVLSTEELSDVTKLLSRLVGLESNSQAEILTDESTVLQNEKGHFVKEQEIIDVQLLDPLPAVATKTFIAALERELVTHGIRINVIAIEAFNADATGTNTVIMVCNNYSRLEGNVTNTIKKINGDRLNRVLLMVLHCQRQDQLPKTPSKTELKNTKEFADVVDIAFDKDVKKPIYDCEMNRQAFGIVASKKSVFKVN